MQIIIGRDAKTSQLNVIIGQQTLRLGAPGSVPQTVSRQHCRITVTEGGTYLVENLKAANITYINNVGVEKKSMRREDSLALGTDRYQVDTKAVFAAIDKAVPKTADIRPLSKVWEDHEEYIINQKREVCRHRVEYGYFYHRRHGLYLCVWRRRDHQKLLVLHSRRVRPPHLYQALERRLARAHRAEEDQRQVSPRLLLPQLQPQLLHELRGTAEVRQLSVLQSQIHQIAQPGLRHACLVGFSSSYNLRGAAYICAGPS